MKLSFSVTTAVLVGCALPLLGYGLKGSSAVGDAAIKSAREQRFPSHSSDPLLTAGRELTIFGFFSQLLQFLFSLFGGGIIGGDGGDMPTAPPTMPPSGPESCAFSGVAALTIPATVTGDTSTVFGTDPPFPDICTSSDGEDVETIGPREFREFTVDADKTITLTTCNAGTDYDTVLSVFSCAGSTFTCVDAHDEGGFNNPKFCSVVTIDAKAGETYFVVINGFGSDSGKFELSIAEGDSIPPQCQSSGINAPVALPATVTGNTVGTIKTVNFPSVCRGIDVFGSFEFVEFVASSDGTVELSTCNPGTDFDTQISVFTCVAGAFDCVASADDPTCTDLRVSVEEGRTYFVVVNGFELDEGNYELTIEELSGTQCEAVPTSPLTPPSTFTGSTSGSTSDLALPGNECNFVDLAGNFQFTQFSVDFIEQVTLSTCNPGTNFDTQISVFVCDGDGLTCVAAEDDPSCTILTITAEADVVYFVVVNGFDSASGDFELTINTAGPPFPIRLSSP